MQEIEFLSKLFDEKLIKILSLFFQFPNKKFYLQEVSDSTKVSLASCHRALTKFVRLEILDEIKISKFKVYQLAKNEKTDYLSSFIKQSVKVVDIFADKVKDYEGVEMIILHGKEKDNKANVLVIGNNIPAEEIKNVVVELREQYNFTISYLTLTQDQYEQMSAMGLYSGTKKTLYKSD